MKKPSEIENTTPLTLEVQLRIVFGRELIYPINDRAKLMAEFINKKTFSRAEIDQLKGIGFEVNWVANYDGL